MTQNLDNELSILLAKTGVFFANSDGNFSSHEKDYISNFLQQLKKFNAISNPVEKQIEKICDDKISFDNLINDTKSLIVKIEPEEKDTFIQQLDMFIQGIIEIDGTTRPKEMEYYKKWQSIINN